MAENQGIINAIKESNKNAAIVIKDELKDQLAPFTAQIVAPLNQILVSMHYLALLYLKNYSPLLHLHLKVRLGLTDKNSAIEDKKGACTRKICS